MTSHVLNGTLNTTCSCVIVLLILLLIITAPECTGCNRLLTITRILTNVELTVILAMNTTLTLLLMNNSHFSIAQNSNMNCVESAVKLQPTIQLTV